MTDVPFRYRNDENCHCWVPVFGTLLIMISLIDLGFGVGYGAIISEVALLKDQLAESSTKLKVAGFFSSLTGGLVNLGDSRLGESAKEIVSNFNHIQFSWILAWIRIAISIIGIIAGFFMCFRIRWSPVFALFVAASSMIAGFIGLIASRNVYRFLLASGMEPLSVIIGILDVLMHVVWPVLLGLKLILARGKQFFPGW